MLYFETLDLMAGLPDADVGALVRAGSDLIRGSGEPKYLSRGAQCFWPLVRREVERDSRRYAEKLGAPSPFAKKKKPDLFVPCDQDF